MPQEGPGASSDIERTRGRLIEEVEGQLGRTDFVVEGWDVSDDSTGNAVHTLRLRVGSSSKSFRIPEDLMDEAVGDPDLLDGIATRIARSFK